MTGPHIARNVFGVLSLCFIFISDTSTLQTLLPLQHQSLPLPWRRVVDVQRAPLPSFSPHKCDEWYHESTRLMLVAGRKKA